MQPLLLLLLLREGEMEKSRQFRPAQIKGRERIRYTANSVRHKSKLSTTRCNQSAVSSPYL